MPSTRAKTVKDWEEKGWLRQSVGYDPREFSHDPTTHKLVVKGLFDAYGYKITGKHPKLVIEPSAGGSMVSLDPPSESELLVVYKLVELEAEDEDGSDAEEEG